MMNTLCPELSLSGTGFSVAIVALRLMMIPRYHGGMVVDNRFLQVAQSAS